MTGTGFTAIAYWNVDLFSIRDSTIKGSVLVKSVAVGRTSFSLLMQWLSTIGTCIPHLPNLGSRLTSLTAGWTMTRFPLSTKSTIWVNIFRGLEMIFKMLPTHRSFESIAHETVKQWFRKSLAIINFFWILPWLSSVTGWLAGPESWIWNSN